TAVLEIPSLKPDQNFVAPNPNTVIRRPTAIPARFAIDHYIPHAFDSRRSGHREPCAAKEQQYRKLFHGLQVLPMQPERKLNLSGVRNHGSYGSLRRRPNASIRQSKICVIQHVEKLGTELQAEPFGQRKILVRTQIPGPKPWTNQNIAAGIAKRV